MDWAKELALTAVALGSGVLISSCTVNDIHHMGECVNKEVTFAGFQLYQHQVCDLPPNIDTTPLEDRMEQNEQAIEDKIELFRKGEGKDDD